MKSVIFFSVILLSVNFLPGQTTFHSTNSLSVSLEPEEDAQVIYWETPREINTSYFIIERSDSGREFKGIAMIKANGYAQGKSLYHFEDVETLPYQNYRITLVMMDGTRISAEPIKKTKPDNHGKTNVLAVE